LSKFILPWFGGTPAVWTTCMVFFQTVLFLGYAYAHLSQKILKPRAQVLVHLLVLVAAVSTLHIAPDISWKLHGSESPVGSILLLLSACVGLPYFAVATTGPLVQAWFSRAYSCLAWRP
jgi:phosphatidylserine synthase